MNDQLFNFILQWPVTAASVLLLILLALAGLTLHNQRTVKRLRQELKQMRNDIKALTATSLGIGRCLIDIERRQRLVLEAPPINRPTPIDIYEPANQPYDHAIHLAQQGRDVQEIVSICGVSQNEAELIKMMHRLDKAS